MPARRRCGLSRGRVLPAVSLLGRTRSLHPRAYSVNGRARSDIVQTSDFRGREVLSVMAKITGQYPGSYLVRSYIFFQLYFFFRRRGSASGDDLGWSKPAAEPLRGTILFVAVSVAPSRLATDWAEDCDKNILRRCPFCERDSIIGHGRRRKQAHDEHHDWIWIRRGRCADCGTTFTFLPLLSLPYTHFSLLARCQALLRRIAEHCSWEKASPKLKDPDRLPDPSTVRRWLSDLDFSQPALSFLNRTVTRVAHWLARGHQVLDEAGPLSSIAPTLEVLCPLRL